MTRLYLIRHAKPAAQWGGSDDDPGLDPAGERQAADAAAVLMSLPAAVRPTTVASSPLRRCLETARVFAARLGAPVEIVGEVGEIPTPAALAAPARGPWLRAAFLGRWSEIDGDLDYDQWRHAVYDAVRARPGAAIFSHFVAINAVLSLIDGRDNVIGFRPDHASITTLEVVGEALRLVSLGREAATGVL